MSDVVIVGGGVVGTMHALASVRRGHTTRQLESDLEPRKASVRTFGLIWVSGRASGDELALALRARERWEAIATDVPEVGLRPDGSLTVAQDPREISVLEEVASLPDAGDRGFEMLEADDARGRNPALRGKLLGALFCSRDAIVEPARVLPAVRRNLEASGRYAFVPGRTALNLDGTRRAVRLRVGRDAVRPPAGESRIDRGCSAAAGATAMGRRLLPGHR